METALTNQIETPDLSAIGAELLSTLPVVVQEEVIDCLKDLSASG